MTRDTTTFSASRARSPIGRLAIRLGGALATLAAAACLSTAAAPAELPGAAHSPARAPRGRAARTVYLREYASLHLIPGSESESTLRERGSASGTFGAPLGAQLTLSAEHVSAVFTIYPRGGSITGRASARFIVRGHTGYYGGTLTITHGTGSYRHASGRNIGISGTINRYNFALTVKANGWMKL